MKQPHVKKFIISSLLAIAFFGTAVFAASTGTIDPSNAGNYKAAFLDTNVVSDTAINFGKFTTQSQYNITVSDTELRGYAWGSSVGWIVTNCADTTSGCSSTNGNFKIANSAGSLSGYAWGENTGWINFGPFTDSGISTVKIGTDGNFGGTLGNAGYAWSQNYGWIVFDCSNAATCVNTDWGVTVTPPTPGGGGTSGGGGAPGGGTTVPVTPVTPVTPPENPSTPTTPTTPAQTPEQPPATSTPDEEPSQPPVDTATPPAETPPPSNNEPGLFDNGLVFPPAFTEALGGIVGSIGVALEGATNAAKEVSSVVLTAARTTTGKTVSTAVTATGVVVALAGSVVALALSTPFLLVDLLFLPMRLWSLLLIFFGMKKRHHPWGTVYDSVTKQPIDPAYVMLMDMNGNEIATSITDIDGRYGFAVPAGTYKIVANKTNFEFPSKKLAGKDSDELYADLYFGGVIVIEHEGDVITKNIPLDQLNFDWNEFAKVEQKRLSYYKRSDVTIARLSAFFFWLGAAVATISLIAEQSIYNKIIFAVYLIMFLVRQYSPQFQPKGSITDMAGEPLPFAILRVRSAATGQELTHKVADRLGNFYCLIPNGTYTVSIDKKNLDATYATTVIPTPITVTKGYLKEDFRI